MRQIAFEVRKSRHIYYNKPPTQKSKALYIIILAIFRWQPNYWFNGIPFSIREKRILDCQYGLKYYKGREFTGERLCLQGTMKQGCSAHIHTYIPYPVSSYTKPRSKMKEWKVKKEVLQELRKAIEDGDGNGVSKYFVSLPFEEAHHKCHTTGKDTGIAKRVHLQSFGKFILLLWRVWLILQKCSATSNTTFTTICVGDLPDSLDLVILSRPSECP